MRLVRTSMRLFTALALSFCLVQGVGAQAKPAKKTGQKAKAAAAAAPAATPAVADASANAKPQISEVGKRDPFVPLVNEHKTGGAPLSPRPTGFVVGPVAG